MSFISVFVYIFLSFNIKGDPQWPCKENIRRQKRENLKSFEKTTELRLQLDSISGFLCSVDEVFAFMDSYASYVCRCFYESTKL